MLIATQLPLESPIGILPSVLSVTVELDANGTELEKRAFHALGSLVFPQESEDDSFLDSTSDLHALFYRSK